MALVEAKRTYTVGERFRALRIGRGLTMADAADLADISEATVQQLENGAANPINVRARTIVGLARAYRMSESEVLDLLFDRSPLHPEA